MAATLVPGAMAPASADVGWTSLVTADGLAKGFPEFLDDGNVKLRLCTQGPGCWAAPGTPEYFWYGAEAVGGGPQDPNKNLKVYLAGIEGTYLNFSISNPPPVTPTVVPGDEVGFGRLRFRVVNLVAGATYKITHPYGVNTFVATPRKGAGEINQTIDAGCVVEPPVDMRPCDWNLVGAGFLGDYKDGPTTFLRQDNALPGALGNINVPGHVTGAPSGFNAVIVEGPNAGGPGIDRLEVTDFAVQGEILNPGTPSTPDLEIASDTGSSSTDNITKETQPTLVGTIDAFAGTEVEVNMLVDGAAAQAVSTTTVDGRYSVALPGLAAGLHSVVAESAGLKSRPLELTVETVAPVVTLESHPPDNTADREPAFTFTSADTDATFECQLLPSIPTFAPCASPETFAAQIDGDHIFTVRAQDVAGNVSDPLSFSLRIDTVAPTVSTRTPVANAVSVGQGGNLAASFGEDVTGVGGATFTLKTATTGVAVTATVSYDATTRVATLNPTASLAPGTSYTATLSSLIKDVADNAMTASSWSFVTAPRPTVITRSPTVNRTGVTQAGNIAARFSENVSGVSRTTFTLKKSTGAAVSATVSYNATTHVATLNPTASLSPGTRYTATLSASIKDADLNSITTTSWSFTTGPRPTVTRKSPAVNVLRVSRLANVTATFSENVSGVSRTSFTLKKTTTGRAVSAIVSYSSRTHVATLNPRVTLASNTRYTVTLSSLIKDADGNRITTTTWRFTTRR